MTKGLTDKFVLYERHIVPEQLLQGVCKIEYAYDEEGRLWQRVHTLPPRYRYAHCANYYRKVQPWHIADVYQWFPQECLPQNARKANTRARLPKTFDRYITDRGGRVEVAGRP